MKEDDAKKIIENKLKSQGWSVNVAYSHSHGADIVGSKDNEKWIIEVKGSGSRPPMKLNYFLSILGEILQRMANSETKYSIAFPKEPVYRKLWDKLPLLAKQRLNITMLLIDISGDIFEIDASGHGRKL